MAQRISSRSAKPWRGRGYPGMTSSATARRPGSDHLTADPQFGALLFRWGESDPLALHLIDNGFGALVAFGGELGGLAGERFKLVAQLYRFLDSRLL